VLTNNLNIAQKCQVFRDNCGVILVMVISSYQTARIAVRKLLTPNFHLIYFKATLDSLKERDRIGSLCFGRLRRHYRSLRLHRKTPYEAPDNAALTLETSSQNTLCESTLKLFDYVSNL